MATMLESLLGSSSIPSSVKTQLKASSGSSNSTNTTSNQLIATPQSASVVNNASTGLSNDELSLYRSIVNENNSYNQEQANINREFQAQQAELANSFSAQEAQKNRDFQLMMSNTSYQRAVEDLKKAGLNPILAYSNGGASTSSGSAAQAHQASGSLAQADTSTLASLINANMNRQTSLQIAKIQADSAKTVAEINSNSSKYGFWTNFLEDALGTESLGKSAKDTLEKTIDWLTNGTGSSYVSSAKKLTNGIVEYNKVKNIFNKTRAAINEQLDKAQAGNS